MRMTATELRANLYKTLDRVLMTGEPVEITRSGRTLKLTLEPVLRQGSILDRLVPHDCIVGDPDDFVHIDWSHEWKPYLGDE
jgi:hypothetical protein